MPTTDTLQLEVFRAGDYGAKGRWTGEDLDHIVRDYDPRRHEAPVTIDHRQEGPAHGWVRSLSRIGDRLIATLGNLSPALAEALRSTSLRKRSVELYRNLSATGRPYLKAVSFLGAAAPTVKGLADPIFTETHDEVFAFEEAIPLVLSHPMPDPRERLQQAGVWRPDWESLGLPAVFAALAESPERETLLRFCEALPPAVTFGTAPRQGNTAFAEDLIGGASAESRDLHQRIAALLATETNLTYRDALLRVR